MKCEIIRDLLPSYIDGLTNSITNEEIDNHLKECEQCRIYYDEMKEMNSAISEATVEIAENIFSDRSNLILKKFRRIRIKWIAISCTAVILVVLGLFWISKMWIQLPYEKVKVEADIQEPITDMVTFDDGTGETVKSSGVKLTGKAGAYRFNYMDCRYKEITINGEKKAVAFVNCQSTVGDYIFRHDPVEAGTEAVWVQGDIEDKNFDNVELIYYMNKGIREIENVSEDEAKKMIEQYGILLWEIE